MLSYQEKLREIYRKQDQIAPLIEGLEKEIPPQSLDHYYVKLKMIIKQDKERRSSNYETISGRKQEIEVEDLFDPLPSEENYHQASVNKLLVLGAAGVGKSTLMQYIAYKWSKGELWNDKFDYVYKVSLKTLLRSGWNKAGEDGDLLKCLVYSHFISKVVPEKEQENYKLKDMPWPNEKDKMLLLLDGYDEVSNLSQDDSEKLLKSINKHVNMILTSRPNAINQDISQKFERKIENIGFDHDGISQYLTWYFQKDEEEGKKEEKGDLKKNEAKDEEKEEKEKKEKKEEKKKKGEALEEFLERNASIRDICQIPVNIAMMCFIWSEGGSNIALDKVSNMSGLYHQVVQRLGFRYYAIQPPNFGRNENELLTEWRSKQKLDELRVLQHVAYKGLTGGGIEVLNEERIETLIIAGMSQKEKKIKISIESSIEYFLNHELKRQMPNIIQVYKYGLLKPEGALPANKEPSETDLQSHNFRFIHLSFQEFLTAQYFAEKLMDNKDQANFATFLAQHRNEPRYFLTLKFLAGILSTMESNIETQKTLRIFWDAIMCNPDGMIELGVETKVTLLMHLFSQVTASEETIVEEKKIAEEKSHKDVAESLIDSVILRDLSGWSSQLKESGYTSENIRKGLVQYFVNNNINWATDKSFELQKKLSPESNKNTNSSHQSEEDIMEIIRSMIDKFSEQEQSDMFLKARDILQTHNEEKWRLTKKAIDLILTIRRKTKLQIGMQEEKQILDSLLMTAYDNNLDEVSCNAISEILGKSPNQSSLTDTVLEHIKQELDSLKRVKNFSRLETISHILLKKDLSDIEVAKNVIHSLTSFFQDVDVKIRLSASKTAIEFLTKDEKMNLQFVKKVLDVLIALLLQPEKSINDSASKQIIQLVKKSYQNDPQLLKTTIERLLPHLKQLLTDVQRSVFNTLLGLVKIHVHKSIQPIRNDLNTFISLLKKSYGEESKMILDLMIQWIKVPGNSDTQLIQDTVNDLIQFIQDSTSNSNSAAAKTIIGLIKSSSRNKPQLIGDTLNRCIGILENPKGETRTSTLEVITGLISISDKNDLQISRTVLNAFIQLFKKPNDSSRSYVKDEIINLIGIIGNIELTRDTLNLLIPTLKDPHSDVRDLTEVTIIKLIESSGNDKNQILKDILHNLTSLLNDSQGVVRISASKTLTRLMKITGSTDAQLARQMFDALAPLLKDFNSGYSSAALDQMLNIIEINPRSERKLARNIFDTGISVLKHPNYMERCIYQMIDLMEKTGSSDMQLTNDIFQTLQQILTDPQGNVRDSASKAINVYIKIKSENETQLVSDVINTLTPLLEIKQRDPYLRKLAYRLISQLMEAKEKSEPQKMKDVLNNLTPHLHDSDQTVRGKVSKTLVRLFNISGQRDTELTRDILAILIPLLKNKKQKKRSSVLSYIVELSDMTGLNEDQIFKDALNNLIPFLKEAYWGENDSAPSDIITLARISPQKDAQLARDLFETLTPLLQSGMARISNAVSETIIGVMKFSGKYDTQLVQEIFEILTSVLQKSNAFDRSQASHNIIKLIGLTNNMQLVSETIKISIKLLHSDPGLAETATELLEMMVLEILLQHPDDLTKYFTHPSKDFRNLYLSNVLKCLKKYVENFEILEQLLKNTKSSLTPRENENQFFEKIKLKFSYQLRQSTQELLIKLEIKDLSKEDSSKYLSELKSLLIRESEINQIGALKGTQIIELALIVIGKEKISVDDSNHQKLIEIAKEVLTIQADSLNEDGLKWINDNHEKLISLSPETKFFARKVCLKLLEHEKMTPLEEDLLIKFIKQGLTTSLKIYKKDEKDYGEIIFEGKRHQLKGDDVIQTLEKIAKTIIDQQQDLLALQYKEHKPIFPKSKFEGGIKQAAADYQDVRSIADKRHSLKNNFWLLTKLNSLTDSQTNIILLEKRNAFGDHFIFRLNDKETFRLYPNDISELKKIFDSYRFGEVYKGTVKELTESVGQKLFESKSIQDIDNIEGKELSKQTYFQQELLREGSEDRNQQVEEELEKKLNDNRKLLEKRLKSLKISDDDEKRKIQEYYEGFVSTFSTVHASSQAIANGQLTVDTGEDYFSLLNLIIQFRKLDPLGIGDMVGTTLDKANSYLKERKIVQKAKCVTKIAIDAVELSDLVGQTVLRIIKKPTNRQRIFDAKEEIQLNSRVNQFKNFFEPMLEKLKDGIKKIPRIKNLFLEEIKTTSAFQLGEDDANEIIKKWIELMDPESKLKSSLPRSKNEKCKYFAKLVSAASSQQNNQQNNNNNGDHCAIF